MHIILCFERDVSTAGGEPWLYRNFSWYPTGRYLIIWSKASKVWWNDATLFVYLNFLVHTVHSVHQILTIHSSVAIRRGSSPSAHRWSAHWEKPPRGAEPRIEVGHTLQQADALPSELRRTRKHVQVWACRQPDAIYINQPSTPKAKSLFCVHDVGSGYRFPTKPGSGSELINYGFDSLSATLSFLGQLTRYLQNSCRNCWILPVHIVLWFVHFMCRKHRVSYRTVTD